jgi:heptosyltransferase-2
VNKILVIKHSALGDVVRTAYTLPGIKEKYPLSEIWWMTSENAVALLRYNPYISKIISNKNEINSLTEIEFDLVLSLDDEIEILNILHGIKRKKIIGAYLHNGVATYTDSSALWFDMGLISRLGKNKADELKKNNRLEHNEILGKILGINITAPCFWNSAELEKKYLKSNGDVNFYIGLNSGAGSRWPSKELRISEAIELTRILSESVVKGKPVKVILLGGIREKDRNLAIMEAVGSPNVTLTKQLALLDFAAFIAGCDYIITSDSLTLHLAISQHIPNLGFFAPTSSAEIGVFNTGVKVESLSNDYCSYRPDADNSTITAKRILDAFNKHIASI